MTQVGGLGSFFSVAVLCELLKASGFSKIELSSRLVTSLSVSGHPSKAEISGGELFRVEM